MINVLHLDSSIFFSRVISDICESYDMNYLFANNSEEAIKLIRKNKIDLIISSIKLKKEDAEIFLKEIKKEKKIIVIISSDKRPEYKDELIRLGADEFVCKDITFDTVIHNYMRKFKKSHISKIKN